jgi:ring-1,2-phenylacetyl-CoA epoxidase subunit PaaC
LSRSKDQTLAAIAAKAEKEMAYHIRHSGEWVIRLGDGTAESHARAQAALDELYAYSNELFETDEIERALIEAGIAADPATLRGEW